MVAIVLSLGFFGPQYLWFFLDYESDGVLSEPANG